MNIKTIKSLADILNQSGLTAIDVTEGDVKIRLEKSTTALPAQLPSVAPTPAELSTPEPVSPQALPQPLPQPNSDEVVDFNKISEVKSPMVGIFYSSPSPESPPFVEVGGRVKKGDVLCIIEAMKLMNEIIAECDGEIVDVCAENGQLVEFSQVLLKIF